MGAGWDARILSVEGVGAGWAVAVAGRVAVEGVGGSVTGILSVEGVGGSVAGRVAVEGVGGSVAVARILSVEGVD